MAFSTPIRLALVLSLTTTPAVAQLSSIITEYYCPVVSRSTLLPGCGSYAEAFYATCAPFYSASKIAEYSSCGLNNPAIGALECSCYNELVACAGTTVSNANQLGAGFCGGATNLGPGPVIATTNSTSTSESSAESSAAPSSIASSTATSTGAGPESSGSAASATTSGPEAGTSATQSQASSTSSAQASSNAAPAVGNQPALNVLGLSVGLVIVALV